MYCIALTGTIASGKSTALAYFQDKGALTLSADDSARRVVEPGQPALDKISSHFGRQVLHEDGRLNRKVLRQLIFNDKASRLWLENLLHPLIRRDIKQQLLQGKGCYAVLEIPLLTDKAPYPYVNRVLAIMAPEQQILKRLIQRDQCSLEQAKAILAAQPDTASRRRLADDIVENDADTQAFLQQLDTLHARYLLLAGKT